ncbi:tetratricopeptide repeat protein [Rufibacter roseus]|uniref:Tetratricopeptide repeat protein n=1 Tax=Rufibacter roseus TaxID=1567108 RepID=A0ABW2DK34_9BACT|nr:SEL1-like repeat protein [Rufibacter roseus]
MKPHYYLLLLVLLAGCKSTQTASSNQDQNNVVKVTTKGSAGSSSTRSGDQVIFNGSNNLVDIVSENAAYFNNSHDVIIIQGSHNIIKLYNTNVLQMDRYSTDTLVLVGNNQRYVMLTDNEVHLKKSNVRTDTVQMTTPAYNFNQIAQEVKPEDKAWETIQHYLTEIKQGNKEAYYQLAEMYNFSLQDVPLNTNKAIELYEYGAANQEILSIRRLADIWYKGTFDKKPDKNKGLYYYKLGAQLGDEYCKDALATMNSKQ